MARVASRSRGALAVPDVGACVGQQADRQEPLLVERHAREVVCRKGVEDGAGRLRVADAGVQARERGVEHRVPNPLHRGDARLSLAPKVLEFADFLRRPSGRSFGAITRDLSGPKLEATQ